jgi:protease-4
MFEFMKQYFLWLFKVLSLVIIFFVLIPVLVGAAFLGGDAELAKLNSGSKRVAVVEVTGVIESAKEIVEQLHEQIEDSRIEGIVLRVNSPGGAVAPSQEIHAAVERLKAKKPIVASMGSVAASGGLYAAVAASKVYCQPGTMTGSIGVVMNIPNFRKIAENIGFEMVTVKSGKFKDVGNSFREMSSEEKVFLEQMIDRVQDDFVGAVVKGRGLDEAKVREFADGRIIVGSQAKELKLVDGFGDVYDAARAVFELKGTPLAENEQPTLIYALDPLNHVRKFFDSIMRLPNLLNNSVELRYLMQ